MLKNYLFLDRQANFCMDVRLPSIQQGVVVLFGPSGCGKTTVLRCLAGLEKAEGYLALGREIWQDSSRNIFCPPYKRKIGYVFQSPQLFPHKTVKDNILLGIQNDEKKTIVELEKTMHILGIYHLMHRYPHRLSGGEAQRVSIARALLRSPDLLLMDEPLSALDHRRKDEILHWLARIRKTWNIPMVYVTHSIEEVIWLADYVVQMEDGKVVRQGSIRKVLPYLSQETVSWNFCTGYLDKGVVEIAPEYVLFSGRAIEDTTKRVRVILDGYHAKVSLVPRQSASMVKPWTMRVQSIKIQRRLIYLRLIPLQNKEKEFLCIVPNYGQKFRVGQVVWVEWFGIQLYG